MIRLLVGVAALTIATVGHAGVAVGPLINEFAPNPVGNSDPATTNIELLGEPGAAFSGVLVAIESDGANGSVQNTGLDVEPVSGIFDANGLLLLSVPDLENPSFTLVLAEAFNGDSTTDIDLDDDGVADNIGDFVNVFDAVNVPDSASDAAITYASDLGGTDLPAIGDEPQLVFRDSVTLEFLLLDDPADPVSVGTLFDSNGDDTGLTFDDEFDTFGAVNPTITTAGGDPDGDYNDDGVVNAADFTAFRDLVGAPNGALPNDPNASAIGPDQFSTFVAAFDAAGAVTSAAVGVPEPASASLGLLLGGVCFWRRRG